MTHTTINPAQLSKPTGYSHVAIVAPGKQVYLAGQVALDTSGTLVGKGDLGAQAAQVYRNLEAGLAAAGLGFKDVFKLVTYVVDLTPEKAAQVRAVRSTYFGDGPFPASTMVGVTSLVNPDLLVEIEVIAAPA